MLDEINVIDTLPFSLNKSDKSGLYARSMLALTRHHYAHCAPYKRILDLLEFDPDQAQNLEILPFLPVRLFKDYELLSTEKDQIVKTMTSSGTSGQKVSKIFLDRKTATDQTRVLTKIVADFIGKKRLPMLIVDTKSVLKNRNHFSARGAGILGFSMLGYDLTYALDEEMRVDYEGIERFCIKHENEKILLFGFTSIIWEYLYLQALKEGRELKLDNGILIHGGGWKKLIAQAVDNDLYKESLREVFGLSKIYNYYGMVEQTGSVFMECEAGHLHCSIYSDVIIRDKDFKVCPFNEKGMIQLVSLLPSSYPGHSILSEDLGEILGEDDCSCGRMGKYFKVHGRLKSAEIRGCSDTHSTN